MENIINDAVLKTIQLKEEIIYKVSMSKISIPDSEYNEFRNKRIIVVNGETKAKGTSTESQGENFSSKMKIGDYFFLCRGNEKLEIIGKITGEAKNCEFGDKTYLQRTYNIVIEAIKEGAYAGEDKWWTPRNNSTCIPIKGDEIDKANKELFIPFFNVQFLPKNNPLVVEDIFESMKTLNTPLNQILFGPPGTGKTYNTVNKAIEIANPSFKLDQDREEIKAEFDRLMTEDQVVFTTFHQSMCYEDFIEGIKPLKPLTDDSFVKYDVQPGIFKQICDKAKSNFENAKKENKNKVSFETVFEKLKEDYESNPEIKFKLKTEGKDFTIIGFTSTSIQFKKGNGSTNHTLSINTLKDLYYDKRKINISEGVGIYYPSILDKLRSYGLSESAEVQEKSFVLVIDEINRGNVSQIFGELITLIEDDKRLGCLEALEVTLPYSKEKFGVPSNLYIIGTMNTADRSVEALDAALRRRFSFEEMPPDSDLILKEGKLSKTKGILESDEFDDINLPLLLNKINERLEKLLDKDHQIGHSYFINVEDLNGLKLAFQNKIIPLLQEYFFGDYGKIGLVLGEGFVEKEPLKESIFAYFPDADADDFTDRSIFKIKKLTSDDDFINAINSLLNN